ncbi:hypothetical protein LTR49_025899 [Elasticomyces elasticus]|nr:hypothetical protein LTR49_025899 [Elasticomyces elasticus]
MYRGLPESDKALHILQNIIEVIHHADRAMTATTAVDSQLNILDAETPNITPGYQLPYAYDNALGRLGSVLEGYYISWQVRLMPLLTHTATFQKFFGWNKDATWVEPLMAPNEVYRKDRLLWCFAQLSMSPSLEKTLVDRSLYLHYIEDLLQLLKEKIRVDQTMYDHFSRMLGIHGALSIFARHLPRDSGVGRQPELEGVQGATNIGDPLARVERYEPLRGLLRNLMRAPLPTGKATAPNVERLKVLHGAAGKFWDELMTACRDLAASKNNGEHLESMAAHRNQEHRAGFERKWERMLEEVARRARPAASKHQALHIQTTWGSESSSSNASTQRKEKPKTRRENSFELATHLNTLQLEANQETIAPDNIFVARGSKGVLTRMFAGYGEATGMMKWDEVAAALVDAGVSAVHIGGSAVTFTHADALKGSIVFHRPHPDPTLSTIRLRSMGKRLGKWFGWDTNYF